MIGVSRVEEVELGIAELILSNTGFKLWSIAGYETCSFVNNV